MLELEKFLKYGYPENAEPVTFARYTGQESPNERAAILAHPPDIILTNYVMLDLVLTRPDERKHLVRAAEGLDFLVLDELHTYRGRQGSDVAMLIRRVRNACNSPRLQIVGTSATMASGGTVAERSVVVANVATRLFGTPVRPERIIGETLIRATATDEAFPTALANAIVRPPETDAKSFVSNPLAAWLESTFGVVADPTTGLLIPSDQQQSSRPQINCTRSPRFPSKNAQVRSRPRCSPVAASSQQTADRSLPSGCTNSCRRATRYTPVWNRNTSAI